MEKKETYTPRPISTEGVVLPEELCALAEELARNVHDVWAQQRIREGWTYGCERNDEKKKHPCLVPYEELPETEKDYDRHTSQETLRLILKLGFRIENPTLPLPKREGGEIVKGAERSDKR